MSMVSYNSDTQESSYLSVNTNKAGDVTDPISEYQPDEHVKDRITEVIKAFTYGDMNLRKPRREFNDLAALERMNVDQMAFNTYEPNNGDYSDADQIQSWRSRAVRPVVRNKIISIAAHATARLIFPKVFAQDADSNDQKNAAIVMSDLMEWSGEQCDYPLTSLTAILTAMWSPASIVFTGFEEVYRTVREKGEDGKMQSKQMLDEVFSGFKDSIVPVDELYIENFYENNIQKQGWVVWRRVISHDIAKLKYKKYENFKYVKPGVQVVYNDANMLFYEVYDSNMRQFDVEEVIYWNRSEDLMLMVVNGVLMNDPDEPNPRNDKLYPFAKFGYEYLDEGKCFYYKSLAFKMGPDARIVNTLYPMIIDGTYLNVMPPMIVQGGETIGSDVVVPGAITTISDPDAKLTPINSSMNLSIGMSVLEKVESSTDESSEAPITAGQDDTKTNTTAYQIGRMEQNAATILGLFIQMIRQFVQQYGNLRIGDILQYMTIAGVNMIEGGNPDLVYKTFLMPEKPTSSGSRSKKISFDINLPDEPMDDNAYETQSFKALEEGGGLNSKTELWKVNPYLFRNMKYMLKIDPDVMNPMSEDLERAFLLEEYDRAIANPLIDPDQATKDFLLGAYAKSKKDPDKYMKKMMPMQPGMEPQNAIQGGGSPTPVQTTLPNAPSTGKLSALAASA